MNTSRSTLAAGLGLVVALAASTTAAAVGPTQLRNGRADFDARRAPAVAQLAAPVAGAVDTARATLLTKLGAQGIVQLDRLTGTPRIVAKLNGYLTAASTAAPKAIALDYVKANSALFGLDQADLDALQLKRDRTGAGGVRHFLWAQTYQGIEAFDNDLRVNVAQDGRIINVLGSPKPGLRVASTTPGLTALQALQAAARDAGRLGLTATPLTKASTPDRRTTFTGGHEAKLTIFNQVDGAVLAWRVRYFKSSTQIFDTVLDATTGRVLWRDNRVDFASGLAWDYYPGAPKGGVAKLRNFDPYLTDKTRLLGNNAHVYSDLADDITGETGAADGPQADDEVRPQATGNWAYPFVRYPLNTPEENCPAAGCTWNYKVPFSWQTNLPQNATQVFWYVNHYKDFLSSQPIAFSEGDGNFQEVNATTAGKPGDRLEAQVLDGANATGAGLPDTPNHVDNANMYTPPDGTAPRMQMYLFEPLPLLADAFASINGGDEAGIVYHEYTHGLSNRLITDADGNGALSAGQSGAMGEAWGDFFGSDLLVAEGVKPDTAAAGDVKVGDYTDGGNDLVRTQGLDCPANRGGAYAYAAQCPGTSDAGTGGYTYGDYGKVIGSPEVHADGEIWGETLWDLRQAIGVQKARLVVSKAMELTPPNPSFLDMRNAILQADVVYKSGVQATIWKVFANRGMGFYASTLDGGDSAPVEDFHTPPAATSSTGSITGTVTDQDSGKPVGGATAAIGGRYSGLPNDLKATTASTGKYTLTKVPYGTYPALLFAAPGYDRAVKGPVTVNKATVGPINATLRRDWVNPAGGAKVTSFTGDDYSGFGCGPTGALDGSLGTGWGSTSPTNADDPGEKQMTVQLPRAVDLTQFAVDPGATCGDDDTASLGDYRIETSKDGVTFTEAASGTFTPDQNHRLNPVAPAAAAAKGVRYVRMVMAGTQGPAASVGGTSFQDFMDMTELEVYGTPAA